jgi:hypothetical protein
MSRQAGSFQILGHNFSKVTLECWFEGWHSPARKPLITYAIWGRELRNISRTISDLSLCFF